MRGDFAPSSGKVASISSVRFAAVTIRNRHAALAIALLALGTGADPAAAADAATATEPAALPINLDANSSEIDRTNGHVVFRGLKITQGTLVLQADTAEASRLDFDDSRWVFTGQVVVEDGATRASCDNAELTFIGHQLRVALLKGSPASFERRGRSDQPPSRGRANTLDYNLDAGLIGLSGDAWVTDGSNEVSGERLSYDLRKGFVLAESSEGKKVRMLINPPKRKGTAGKTP